MKLLLSISFLLTLGLIKLNGQVSCVDNLPSDLLIPNIVTPNDDGQNDYFKVISEELVDLKVQIYNRWGNLLYTYTGKNGEWDMTLGGKPITEGVYFYTAEITTTCTTEKQVKQGSFTVVK